MESLKLRCIDTHKNLILLDYEESLQDEILDAMEREKIKVTIENDTKIVAVENI